METSIKIESDFPIPKPKGHPYKYPFDKMKIGDSFFVPDVSKKFSIYSSVREFNVKNSPGIIVTQRREGNGVRVWRIK